MFLYWGTGDEAMNEASLGRGPTSFLRRLREAHGEPLSPPRRLAHRPRRAAALGRVLPRRRARDQGGAGTCPRRRLRRARTRTAHGRNTAQRRRHGVFHRDDLEGAWTVEGRSGLDDFFPGEPGPWDEVYFEKEAAGSIRIGKKRVRFDAAIDEAAHTMTLARWGLTPSSPLAGRFELRGEDLRFTGDYSGAPFALTMKRDYPR